jgi:hypothetical protein
MSTTIGAVSDRATKRAIEAQKGVDEAVDGIDTMSIFFKLVKKAEEAAQSAV